MEFLIEILRALLVKETLAWLPKLDGKLLAFALSQLPAADRERLAEEWASHLDELPGGFLKTVHVLSLVCAASRLAYSSRVLNFASARPKIAAAVEGCLQAHRDHVLALRDVIERIEQEREEWPATFETHRKHFRELLDTARHRKPVYRMAERLSQDVDGLITDLQVNTEKLVDSTRVSIERIDANRLLLAKRAKRVDRLLRTARLWLLVPGLAQALRRRYTRHLDALEALMEVEDPPGWNEITAAREGLSVRVNKIISDTEAIRDRVKGYMKKSKPS